MTGRVYPLGLCDRGCGRPAAVVNPATGVHLCNVHGEALRVTVAIDGRATRLAYAAPAGTEVGDVVVLPRPFWMPETDGDDPTGVVVDLSSAYDGPVRPLRNVSLEEREA